MNLFSKQNREVLCNPLNLDNPILVQVRKRDYLHNQKHNSEPNKDNRATCCCCSSGDDCEPGAKSRGL